MKRWVNVQDPVAVGLALVLTLIGIIFSFDAAFARSIQAGHGVLPREFTDQVIWTAISLTLGWLVSRHSHGRLQKLATPLWVVTFVLLVAALFPPLRFAQNGAYRWIHVWKFNFQPAELAKLAVVLYLAKCFSDRRSWPRKIKTYKSLDQRFTNVAVPKLRRLWPAIWVALGICVIGKEPDMGTGLVIVAVGFAIAIEGGATLKSLAWGAVCGAIGCVLFFVAEPYRWTRLVNHSHRWESGFIDDSGFQTVQSEIAMASGHLLGTGIGAGHAKHVIPAATTDFVMATVAEEFGFIGAILVLALLACLVFRLLWRAQKSRERFARLTIIGIAAWLGFQGCVNLLQANGTLPPIGIPFPFVSTGGSSLVALWLAIGVSEALAARAAPTHAVVEEGDENYALSRDGRRDRRSRLSRA